MSQKKILLIVTGSIAAYKSLELVSLLKKQGHFIKILLTDSATKFVTPLSFTSTQTELIKNDLFDIDQEGKMGHIALTRESDLTIIYPATANFIAKIAQGRADDLASNVILASNKKIFLAPAMNVEMWHNNLTQENLAKLQSGNFYIISPEAGNLACGESGMGRLQEADAVAKTIAEYFLYKDRLAGKNILITAGGTIEKIDPVRFIGNFSSGKQAIALARQYQSYGANVTLVIGNVSCDLPRNMKIINSGSALEMQQILFNEISNISYDYFFMAAAVCDYRVVQPMEQKIKKTASDNITLELCQNPDIVKSIAQHEHRPKVMIAFAAETENLIANAIKKLINKECDYIIANNVKEHNVFGSCENNINLIDKNEHIISYAGSKAEVANFIMKNLLS